MRKLGVVLAAVIMIVTLVVGGSLMGKKPPSFVVPCEATAIKVHISDMCGKSMWIDVLNSGAVEAILCPPCSKKPAQEVWDLECHEKCVGQGVGAEHVRQHQIAHESQHPRHQGEHTNRGQ